MKNRNLMMGILAIWAMSAAALKADIIDEFTGAGPDGALWFLPVYTKGVANIAQTNDRLEVTATLTPSGVEAFAGLRSKAAGLQTAAWFAEVYVFLDDVSAFSGMTANDAVHGTLRVDPSGPGSGGDDQMQVNFAVANLGAGFDHFIRFESETNGTVFANAVPLNVPGPLTAKILMTYNPMEQRIYSFYDVGAGYQSLGDVITGDWNMSAGEVFVLTLGGGGARLSEETPFGDYAVASGQLYFDNFKAGGAGLVMIPEPTAVGLWLTGTAALIRFRRRAECR